MTAVEDTPCPLTSTLSPREIEMLRGLSEGKANKEIARDLNIAEPTVKLHMKSLYRKMKVSNRTQAALVARDKGLF
jgi:DNA-binding NarL/FixJ family response regulator